VYGHNGGRIFYPFPASPAGGGDGFGKDDLLLRDLFDYAHGKTFKYAQRKTFDYVRCKHLHTEYLPAPKGIFISRGRVMRFSKY
jgi:hypothetical protein